MQGTIIAVDVSKGMSHYQGFIQINQPVSKPIIMKHSRHDFEELLNYIKKCEERSNEQVQFVFESTGVYHRSLQKFLKDQHIKTTIISPLLSAKMRQTELHGNKTDALDCKNIAKVFYLKEQNAFNVEKTDENLREYNRYYEDTLGHLRKYKVTFKSLLDIVFPGYDKVFAATYSDVSLAVIRKYPHPELLMNKKPESLAKFIDETTRHGAKTSLNYATKIIEFAKETYSGCMKDDPKILMIQELVDKFISTINQAERILKKMAIIAEENPNYPILLSVPGIGINLASRILAEIGDMTRFKDRNQITSYAGLDPMIRQSGQIDGLHCKISKKGNKRLRSLLYLAVQCNLRQKKNDRIYNFFKKKRQQANPMKAKAASIACAHKLLVIIYAMCKNGTPYQF